MIFFFLRCPFVWVWNCVLLSHLCKCTNVNGEKWPFLWNFIFEDKFSFLPMEIVFWWWCLHWLRKFWTLGMRTTGPDSDEQLVAIKCESMTWWWRAVCAEFLDNWLNSEIPVRVSWQLGLLLATSMRMKLYAEFPDNWVGGELPAWGWSNMPSFLTTGLVVNYYHEHGLPWSYVPNFSTSGLVASYSSAWRMKLCAAFPDNWVGS